MSTFLHNGSSFVGLTTPYVNVNGTWTPASSVWANHAGTWKRAWPAKPIAVGGSAGQIFTGVVMPSNYLWSLKGTWAAQDSQVLVSYYRWSFVNLVNFNSAVGTVSGSTFTVTLSSWALTGDNIGFGVYAVTPWEEVLVYSTTFTVTNPGAP